MSTYRGSVHFCRYSALISSLFYSLGPKLKVSPETAVNAYQRLYDAGHLPNIANGSRRRSFNVLNHSFVNEGEVSTSLHLGVSDDFGRLSVVEDNELDLLEKTLRKTGVDLRGKEYRFTAKTAEDGYICNVLADL